MHQISTTTTKNHNKQKVIGPGVFCFETEFIGADIRLHQQLLQMRQTLKYCTVDSSTIEQCGGSGIASSCRNRICVTELKCVILLI